MPDIIYDVAVSADGYICGPDAEVSGFATQGPHVDAYTARLATYGTVLMGRRTYEFGYAYGLPAGANPYPRAKTWVFSTTLVLPADAAVSAVRDTWQDRIAALKAQAVAPIYLCGGGAFAGWMLDRGLIDRLRLKRAPVILGGGVSIFGASKTPVIGEVTASRTWANGVAYAEICL
jgi:dihydrofolate reductase